ncbi:MAG: GntR family transcriptional regulator [Deltaproteobacteria bacterium]|nr:GntR family transcriptional regulator [Deltaproteobacteria bacterium]
MVRLIRNDSEEHLKRPLCDIAYEAIYRKIITLELEPGSLLDEKTLIKQIGLGRTPIREALFRLYSDMVIESNPSKGFFVRPITLQDTKAVFEALRIIELGIAELVVKSDLQAVMPLMEQANREVEQAVTEGNVVGLVDANYQFHLAFYDASSNRFLLQALRHVRVETRRLAFLSFSREIDSARTLRDHYQSVIDDHWEMVAALKEKNEDLLKAVITRHIETFRRRMMMYLMPE